MLEAIRNHMAVRTLRKAGVFRGMTVMDRGGVPQTKFAVRHHGVTSYMSRKAAVQLVRTMRRIEHEAEMRTLVFDR